MLVIHEKNDWLPTKPWKNRLSITKFIGSKLVLNQIKTLPIWYLLPRN
jgi:hypothetical protein